MSNLMLDVDQAGELKAMFRREQGIISGAEWTNERMKMFCERRGLGGQLLDVLLGQASITVVEHVIDCDADPFVPDGWSVEEHQKGGSWKWDASKVELWLANGQKNGKVCEGNIIRKEMAKKVPFNACALDYLLANPYLIREEWKGQYVFFWGTVYRNRDGDLYVRFLSWRGGWRWGSASLAYHWRGKDPAAVLAA